MLPMLNVNCVKQLFLYEIKKYIFNSTMKNI